MQSLSSSGSQSWLTWFLKGILILGFLILLARLVELQIIKGSYYKNLAEGNRIRRVIIAAPRGRILARGGEILADNKKTERSQDSSLGIGENIFFEWKRDYPLGENFFHVGGYVGIANKDEVGKINPKCPEKGPIKPGSIVGRSGLEAEYECILSGIDGEEYLEVDTLGKKIRSLGIKKPISGKDLKTSIHFELQSKSGEFMEGKKGALIISDSKGQILALSSSPSFDPNLFLQKESSNLVSAALKNSDLPLFDRAIGGLYHPGSVFKPVIAIAALSEGKINADYRFDDPGEIKIGKFSYTNWYFTQYGKKEGNIGVIRALARSTDTFFYHIGEMLGAEKIVYWANMFGLGKETGIDLPGEISGLIPSPEWKLKIKGEAWFLGNTYHLSIGQGDLALTPIEINAMVSAFSQKGKLCRPKIILDGTENNCRDLGLKPENLEIVKQGMKAVCSTGGTGFTFFDFASKLGKDFQVACKTGTAETNEDGKTHAWFVAFAPVDFPEIVATVLVERGGEGSKVAGPIARKIFDYWFSRKN